MYQEPSCRRRWYCCTACVLCNRISQLLGTSQRVFLELRELFITCTMPGALCTAPKALGNALLFVPRAERSCYKREVMFSNSIVHGVMLLAGIHTRQEVLSL